MPSTPTIPTVPTAPLPPSTPPPIPGGHGQVVLPETPASEQSPPEPPAPQSPWPENVDTHTRVLRKWVGEGVISQPDAARIRNEIVKAVVRDTAQRLRLRGAEFEAAAAHIERASTHWMRHTAGTHQSEQMDIKNVRDNLGHSNIATTMIYLHAEDDARHDATSAGHRVSWNVGESAS